MTPEGEGPLSIFWPYHLWTALGAPPPPPLVGRSANAAREHTLLSPSRRAALCCASPVALHDDRQTTRRRPNPFFLRFHAQPVNRHPARGARQHGGPPAPRASTRRRRRRSRLRPWHGAASGAVEDVVARRPLWAHKDTLRLHVRIDRGHRKLGTRVQAVTECQMRDVTE